MLSVLSVWIAVPNLWGCSKSGTVDTREFYMLVHEKPSVFADSIFELIGDTPNGGGTLPPKPLVDVVGVRDVCAWKQT